MAISIEMGHTNGSISNVARAVFIFITCVLGTYTQAAPTCVPPVLKSHQVGLCSPNGSVVIWDCPTCQPGAGLSVECGREYKLGTKIDCVPCNEGLNYSDTQDIGQCKQCMKCEENQEETRSCKVDRDRSCTCNARHYKDSILKDCKPCSWCCGDNDKYIPECKAMPQRKQCAFKFNGKSCAPTTAIPNTTVTTTAPPVEIPTSQESLEIKTKSQPVFIAITSYDSGNTTGSPDTGLDESPGDLPLYVYLIIGVIVLSFILLVAHIYRNSTGRTRNRPPSTSSISSTMNSRTSTSGELQSSALLLPQEEPKKTITDVCPNKIQVNANNVTVKYIKEAVPLLHRAGNQSDEYLTPEVTVTENSHTQDESHQNCPENILSSDEKQSLEVTQLPTHIYTDICQLLDVKEPFFQDFRMLAEKLGVSKEDIEKIGKRELPTNFLLREHKLIIKTFIKLLKSIERGDVVEVIEVWLNG